MKPVEVLLIEDNAGDTLLIGQILADCQLPVKLHVARDGEQALQMLGDVNLKPSLIVLDLNIPKISGNALLKRYSSRHVPVVVLVPPGTSAKLRRRWPWAHASTCRSPPTYRPSPMRCAG